MNRVLKFALALAIGIIGGEILFYFGVPLAWMLGSMTACTIAAVLNLPIAPLPHVGPVMTAVLGVLLGAGFTPDLVISMLGWFPSILGLCIFILFSAVGGTLYFRLAGGFDHTTALLSAMPGGLIEMVTFGHEQGGNVTLIALVHASRILLAVVSVPYMIGLITGMPVPSGSAMAETSVVDLPISSYVSLLFQILVGMALGRWLRLPAGALLGPMLLSGVLHASGVSNIQPPGEFVITAQLVLGTLVGSRFAGISSKLVLRVLLLSVGYVIILMVFALITAQVLARLQGYEPSSLLLAYAPGGVTEMSLIALSMQTEVAFVSGHHIIRMMIVVATTMAIFKFTPMTAVSIFTRRSDIRNAQSFESSVDDSKD